MKQISGKIFLLGVLIAPGSLHAATLSLDPVSGAYGPGDMFMVTARVDTENGECINAAQVELNYDADWMKATVVAKGGSLLSLWTEEPTVDHEHGRVTFSGGIPGGYCGRVQGDPGKTNILVQVVFNVPGNMIGGKVAKGKEPMFVRFGTSTALYLNDGFGTIAPLRTQNAEFTRELTSMTLKNEWLDVVHADDLPPDQFTATIEHDPNMFEGRYFLAFSTVDKQSGIHHFEIKEDDPERLDFIRGSRDHAEFVVSPSLYYYELKDQELQSRITVRAVDNARNHMDQIIAPLRGPHARLETDVSAGSSVSAYRWLIYGSAPIVILVVLGYLLWVKRRDPSLGDVLSADNQDNHDPIQP